MHNTARMAANIVRMSSETRETAEEINELALEDMVQVYIDEKICYIIVFHDGSCI